MTPEQREMVHEFVRATREAEGPHTLASIAAQLDRVEGAAKTVAEGLAAHILECIRYREQEHVESNSMNRRVTNLEAAHKVDPPPSVASLPPMRSEADSSHDLRTNMDKAANV